jgi:hypothetical protein
MHLCRHIFSFVRARVKVLKYTKVASVDSARVNTIWQKIHNEEPDWRTTVLSASYSEVEKILNVLAERWASSAETGRLAS